MKISEYLPQIITLLQRSPILALILPTGSGKSLGVPAALAAIGTRVMIALPTRAAVNNLYETQKKILSDFDPNLVPLVGTAAEGDIKYNDQTLIIYATSGHVRRKLLSTYVQGHPGPIDFCDVLMFDEIHNGSLDITINLALWEKSARAGVLVPRAIFSSATFPESLKIRFPEMEIFEITGQTFPIEIQYNDKSYDIKSNMDDLYSDISKVIRILISRNPTGNILVFLPGSAEVQNVTEQLASNVIENVEVLQAYGSMSSEDLNRIYQVIPDKRKIILATNIAESALTIDDLDMVIDSMLEKRSETSASGGLRLTLSKISKDSAVQRAGRTGRIRQGFCYRMITSSDYDKLEDKRPDEIKR